MSRTVSIGCQDFETIRREGYFYVDKTRFIKEWWERADIVTLITRPRRFGKTLTMSMLEKFFSVEYADRGDLFEGLRIWEEMSPDGAESFDEEEAFCGTKASGGKESSEETKTSGGAKFHGRDCKYRSLQGTYPVIMLSFAKVKETTYLNARKKICQIITTLYNHWDFLLDSGVLNEKEKEYYQKVTAEMEEYVATDALGVLSELLYRYYGKKVIILLDEYDTPMQEAYVNGYWEELVTFTRSLFNATFKTNPYLERAVMTGITRVSRESMFSDLNNLKVVTTTSDEYAESFGFSEEEVFAALDEFDLSDRKSEVKQWYDGFVFGNRSDIYNPWSIINYLDTRKVGTYWVNTSSNSLAGKLIREGSPEIKMTMESLLHGGHLQIVLDEQVVFSQLDQGDEAVWSLLLASGYLKAVHYEFNTVRRRAEYDLTLTNMEVQMMFEGMIRDWFGGCRRVNNMFLQALLSDDVKAMNVFMNKVALQTFSYFDTGNNPSDAEPERFYHGFVLGMMVELSDRYILTSNRESGFGRYDVMLEPRQQEAGSEALNGIIMEFKVQDAEDEAELSDTVKNALEQIEQKNYEAALMAKGIPGERIRKYGFAFCGKKVLIGKER